MLPHQIYQSYQNIPSLSYHGFKRRPSGGGFIAPVPNFRGEPIPVVASFGTPSGAGLGEGREDPAPLLAVAFVSAAHLAHEAAEFAIGEVAVAGGVVFGVFHQLLGKDEAGVLGVGGRHFANAEFVDVPLLKAGEA
jgi:hypothetical protein